MAWAMIHPGGQMHRHEHRHIFPLRCTQNLNLPLPHDEEMLQGVWPQQAVSTAQHFNEKHQGIAWKRSVDHGGVKTAVGVNNTVGLGKGGG